MASNPLKFPYDGHTSRLAMYDHYRLLFEGKHFEAFSTRIDDQRYTKEYQKLRYIAVNFPGLISKVIADFLFGEPPKIKVDDGDQEFIDGLVHDNNLNVQNYESALSNSACGDALYKIRIGKRNASDTENSIIIEDITPSIYFPFIDNGNVRAKPTKEEIAWTFKHADKEYMYQEIHTSGKIEYHIFELNKGEMAIDVDPATVGITNIKMGQVDKTLIEESLLVHVPNWKTGNRYFGISDYYDLESLFYAINNRITKTDNILDKHSDPILTVPEGVLDEKGEVRREKLNMIEIPPGSKDAKPEYIVWNANLDIAFKEIDKLVEFVFMMSETSPDILGMGNGQSDSGRALKLKLLRTIAKASRKKLYYNNALKQLIFVAQKLAKAHGIKIDGKALNGEPVIPEIEWQDGLPIDNSEQVDVEVKRIDAGLTTKKDAIMRIDGVDDDIADEKVQEINDEDKIELPKTSATPNFPPNTPPKTGDTKTADMMPKE